MLNLYDYLTEEDNIKIKNYIETYYTEADKIFDFTTYIGNKEYLRYWAKNKKKLFHLLGGKLIYKIPISIERPKEDSLKKISKLKTHYTKFLLDTHSLFKDNIEAADHSELLTKLESMTMIYDMKSLSRNKTIEKIIYKDSKHKKLLQIPEGTKPMKALQKVINYFDPDHVLKTKNFYLDLENFINDYSLIRNDDYITGNLCFSIHPLDFFTMSDNASGWESCMSWRKKGCYHLGTVEMMNSNNVICVYLESNNTNFCFNEDKEDKEKYTWNNKKWRQLFYCTKEIIVSGKPYPYINETLTTIALEELRKLAKENWNYTYQFGIEKYLDMIHIGTQYRMDKNREWINRNKTTKHNILFDTKAMYNDMFNDINMNYWCIRNKVKKNTIISYSGPVICPCCGSLVLEEDYYYSYYDTDYYNNRYNSDSLFCSDCKP